MGAVVSLIIAELVIITQSAMAGASAYYSSGKGRLLDIISCVVGGVGLILSLVIAIFLF